MRRAFRVRGKVQGVFYRASAVEEATRRGLRGWVRNRHDGDVEGEVDGHDEEVVAFLAWCKVGPAHARVEGVEVTEAPGDAELAPFHVLRDG